MTDNREILNDAEVDFLLQGAERDAAAREPDIGDGDQTVTMHGDLEQIRLADIFQTFAMSKMQGVLRVRNPLEERQVYCADGHVRVLAPARLTLRRLGQRLIRAGLLAPAQLRRVLVQQRKERVPLGALLVREELVSQEALDEVLELQAAEDLFALFTWQHGTFEFFRSERADTPAPEGFESCPEYEINSLLLEVARRSDEWLLILDAIQSLDEVPQRIGDPRDPDALDEVQRAMLEGVDGQTTYRQLADQTTFGLFECARAARDLQDGGLLGSLPDLDLAELASHLADSGEPQRAVVLLQTLDDRRGDLDLAVVARVASVLERVGERRLASSMLLQAAQRASTAAEALGLAREAARLTPHDAPSLHFLRSVLVAQEAPDPRELARVTLELVDALIDGDMFARALEVLEEARQEDPADSALLVRAARAHQKAKDVPAAIAALSELAEAYLTAGARQKALDAYTAALRLDGSRKDIARTIAAMHRTRAGNIVRWAAAALSASMVGAMGFVWLEQRHHDKTTGQAAAQVQRLLEASDRVGARRELERWRTELGACEAIQDLTSRVEFAEAAEAKRLERQRRATLIQRMSDAADLLARGCVLDALQIYGEVHAEPGMEDEVEEIVAQRLQAVMDELSYATQLLLQSLPPAPDELLGRADVARNLARCTETVQPALLRAYDEFTKALRRGAPGPLPAETRRVLSDEVAQLGDGVAVIRELISSYERALAQSDVERRLDPMFKEAVAREAAGDFPRALTLYRQLAEQHTGASELRAHFRARVTRNATITKLMAALAAATDAGDYLSAHQQLRALRKMFPEVSFDELVQLPLSVRAEPPVAEVLLNGEVAGVAPVVLKRTPALSTEVTVRAPGFASRSRVIRGDDPDTWTAQLTLLPTGARRHGSAVGVPPTSLRGGDILMVDRSGCVSRFDQELQRERWTFRSEDLSGFLSEAIIYGDLALIGSLDGPLRALELTTGSVAWQLDGLATDVTPARSSDQLLVATTDGALHAIDLASRERRSTPTGGGSAAALLCVNDDVVLLDVRGGLTCWTSDLELRWRRELSEHSSGQLFAFGGSLVVADDQGRLSGLLAATGEVRWKRDLGEAALGAAAMAASGVLISCPSRIVKVAARDGEVQPLVESETPTWAGPVIRHGDRLVCATRSKTLQVLDARSGKGLYLLPGSIDSRLLQTAGPLFVVDDDHKVRCHGALR